jgi:hypothetical protein
MLPHSWGGPALRPKRPTRASACDPRFILDPAAAYLSGIERFRLPTDSLHSPVLERMRNYS